MEDIYNFSFEHFLLFGAFIMLIAEFFNIYKWIYAPTEGFIFKIKSNNWMLVVFSVGIYVLPVLYYPIKIWNILFISFMAIFGLLLAWQKKVETYKVEPDGIRNLYSNKLLSKEVITAIRIESNELAIDTTKYLNDLVIKKKSLISPTWDELIKELQALYSPIDNKRFS
ncbi:hypothetical protein [Fulvivirga sediminis]|uniref:Uncharacterized protein n=1 Tax=Fulvivirga sediminis TaxID=2803949 RepID=A0A937F8A6_9BACT|nr:hypothetical protein [Fulvivirga sediminis]MBL3656130.1 hypothetical protein [Fulvivirga sediminis]